MVLIKMTPLKFDLSFLMSKCRALAKSRNPSRISKSVLEKSIEAVRSLISLLNCENIFPANTVISDEQIARSITPITPGNFIHRALM